MRIKRLLYYRDLGFLMEVFISSLRISLISSIKGSHAVIASMPPVNTGRIKNADKDKISKYVNLYLFIRRILGFRDACLTYSILLCYMLRRAGVNARINFGVKKRDCESRNSLNMVGHCWVTVDNQEIVSDYQLLFKCP